MEMQPELDWSKIMIMAISVIILIACAIVLFFKNGSNKVARYGVYTLDEETLDWQFLFEFSEYSLAKHFIYLNNHFRNLRIIEIETGFLLYEDCWTPEWRRTSEYLNGQMVSRRHQVHNFNFPDFPNFRPKRQVINTYKFDWRTVGF